MHKLINRIKPNFGVNFSDQNSWLLNVKSPNTGIVDGLAPTIAYDKAAAHAYKKKLFASDGLPIGSNNSALVPGFFLELPRSPMEASCESFVTSTPKWIGSHYQLDFPQAAAGERQVTLPCCQLGLGRQRQQCGLAAASRAAASWRANRLNERRSTKVEWNVQCRLTGEHFEKIIVGNGHQRVAHHRRLNGLQNHLIDLPESGYW